MESACLSLYSTRHVIWWPHYMESACLSLYITKHVIWWLRYMESACLSLYTLPVMWSDGCTTPRVPAYHSISSHVIWWWHYTEIACLSLYQKPCDLMVALHGECLLIILYSTSHVILCLYYLESGWLSLYTVRGMWSDGCATCRMSVYHYQQPCDLMVVPHRDCLLITVSATMWSDGHSTWRVSLYHTGSNHVIWWSLYMECLFIKCGWRQIMLCLDHWFHCLLHSYSLVLLVNWIHVMN